MELTLSLLPASDRYKLLAGLIVPRPIAWISTINEHQVANCAPFSFFNVFCEEPPLCAVGINLRANGTTKHTLQNIRRTGEFVVNLVDEATANAMHMSSHDFPDSESEFVKAGVTPIASSVVVHPRVAEAVASFECRQSRRIEIGPRHELVLGEMLVVHVRDGVVDADTKRVNYDVYHAVGRMSGTRYCTTRQSFNLPGAIPR